MSDVRPDQIGAVLDAVVGSTGIEGDNTLDGESMRNVPKLEAVCEWLYGRIESAHRGDYPSQCASAESVARAIRRASRDIPYCMGIDIDGLLAIADEIDDYADGGGARFGRVIDSRRAKGYAQRIREALGVTGR